MENTINLSLSIDEVNGILQSLGQMPYAQVTSLVDKVRQQAGPQVQAIQEAAASAPAAE